MRAATPTAAADAAVMDTFQLKEDIEYYKHALLQSIKFKIQSERNLLDTKTDLLVSQMKARIIDIRGLIDKACVSIKENDPRNIMKKGYSAVLDENNKIINDIDMIYEGKVYNIIMSNGSFSAQVIAK